MTLKELVQAAKSTQIDAQKLSELRERLDRSREEIQKKVPSGAALTEFLLRTYSE